MEYLEGIKACDPLAFRTLAERLSWQDFDGVYLREALNETFRNPKSRGELIRGVSGLVVKLPPNLAEYAASIVQCVPLGINSPFRLEPKHLIEVVKNRTAVNPQDPRPLAVYISPHDDWNGAFNVPPRGHEAVFENYRVYYFECATDTEAVDSALEANRGARKLVSLLLLNGHGSPTALALGGEDPGRKGTRRINGPAYVDFTDGALLGRLSSVMGNNAVVVVNSCSVGGKGSAVEGARTGDSALVEHNGPIAEYIGRVLFPDRPGTVYAPVRPISGSEIKYSVSIDSSFKVGPSFLVRRLSFS